MTLDQSILGERLMGIEQTIDILGALAFALLLAAHVAAIAAVRTVDVEPKSGNRRAFRIISF